MNGHGARPTQPGRSVGAPGALLVIISGPSGVGKDTIIEAMRARHPSAERHYVVTCTTRARRPDEVDGRGLPLPSSPETFHAAARRGRRSWRRRRSTATGTGTPRDQVESRRSPRAATRSSRSTSRAPTRCGRWSRSAAHLRRAAVAGGPQRPARWRAAPSRRGPLERRLPATRAHGAGAPGRVRPRGGQRDGPGRAHRGAEIDAIIAAPSTTRHPATGRIARSEAPTAPDDRSRRRGSSRWPSTPPGVPGGRTFTYHVPATSRTWRVGEAVLVEYGRRRGDRRRAGGGRRARRARRKPVLARSAPMGRCCRRSGAPRPSMSRTTTWRHRGWWCGRCCRPGSWSGSSSWSRRGDRRPVAAGDRDAGPAPCRGLLARSARRARAARRRGPAARGEPGHAAAPAARARGGRALASSGGSSGRRRTTRGWSGGRV